MTVKFKARTETKKVYILLGEVDMEHTEILEVFSTSEKAEKALLAAKRSHENDPYWGYDSYSISEHEIL